MRVKANTGSSGSRDAFEAGREAASKAVSGLEGESPALVIVGEVVTVGAKLAAALTASVAA